MSSRRLRKQWNDPLVFILAVLLVFVTAGAGIAGCTGTATVTQKVRIGIDSAYGGGNDGFTGLIKEADFNEKLTDALETRLSYDSRFDVIRTHPAGTPLAVSDTAAAVNRDQPEILLSIHAGYDPDPSVSGMRIYADIPSSERHEASMKFAGLIKDAFSEKINTEINYLYYEPYGDNSFRLKIVPETDTETYDLDTWSLMKQAEVPVVITELIHVSNPDEIARWANEEGYAEAAELYYTAFCGYYGFEPKPVPEPEEEKK